MARPAEYSDQEIIAAGKTLEAAGQRVTPFRIRETLGGGNPKRIKTVWQDYVASAKKDEPLQDVELPAVFAEQVDAAVKATSDDLRMLVARLYSEARAQANAEMRDALTGLREEQEQAAAAEQDAIRTVESLDAKLAQRDKVIESLTQSLEAHKSEAARASGELKQAVEHLAKAEARANRAEARADNAEQRIETLLERLQPLQEAITKIERKG